MNIEKYKESIKDAYASMQGKEKDEYRPAYHLTPLAGTLADPNGLIRVGDVYHICYVTNPLACRTEGRTPCVWGHYSTKDFIHYRREPVAVYPDDRRDRDGVYSGSACAHEGTIYYYYTGNVRHAGDYDYVLEGREQNVLRVESTDAVHFRNKTLLMVNDDFPADMTKHVRDPQMIEKDGSLYMLLGARTKEDQGCILVYQSRDFKNFVLKNRLTTAQPFGYMWECPDLVCLDGQWLLITCPQGIPHETYRFQNSHQCGYFPVAGDFDGEYELGEFVSFDYGFDFYAARTLKDTDRTLLIGWLGMSETDYGRTPSADCGWDQAIAMPRELELRDGCLFQHPLREIRHLRGRHLAGSGSDGFQISADCLELELRLEERQDLLVELREDGQLFYDANRQELTLHMGEHCGQGRDERRMRLERLEALTIFVDASVLEIFINDGARVMTSRIFGKERSLAVKPFRGTYDFYEMNGFVIEDTENQN